MSLLSVLQILGKNVTVIADDSKVSLTQSIIGKAFASGVIAENVRVITYEKQRSAEEQLFDESGCPLYDVILASERVGRASDGNYYSCKGMKLSERVSPIDDLFLLAQKHAEVVTIGIGDGGNEMGMGKAFENVQKHIFKGKLVACATPADLLIATGVSNWACYALGLALFALRSCTFHERYVRKAVGFPLDPNSFMLDWLPSVSRERKILEIVEEFGVKDGIRPDHKLSVDGMAFDDEHSTVIKKLRDVVKL